MNLPELRRAYSREALDEATTAAHPFEQFRRWFDAAREAEVLDDNAMTLATADATGRPSARVVLLTELDAGGLVFFTDYRSRKGRELDANPQAAVVFYWAALERQVRVGGRIERIADAETEAYFAHPPEGSRLAAWAAHQGALAAKPGAREITRPPHWGGYRLLPDEFEFWQGRKRRLHDRVFYHFTAAGGWQRGRLVP